MIMVEGKEVTEEEAGINRKINRAHTVVYCSAVSVDV